MSGRQRILAALSGRDSDRVPLTEIGLWPETLQRWRAEGLPTNVSPHDFFDLDTIEFFSYDASLGLKEATLREDGRHRVYTDGDGCTYRALTDAPGAPELIASSVRSMEDWARLAKNLTPDPRRFTDFRKDIVFGGPVEERQSGKFERCAAHDLFTALVPLEPCWYYLRLLGEEEALANIALDPAFAAAVIENYNEFTVRMVKGILSQGYRFDALWVFSDLCYKTGMLFSPKFYLEAVFPHQKRLFDLAKENGMRVIYHSDGYVGELLPFLIDAGIDCMQPLEARAGNDVRTYLREHGNRISYMGNIDMDVMATTRERIEQEISSKLTSAKASRRYLFHSDHSVPPTVSFENYRYALELAHELARY
jgi:uroporphyrinogen decarboxylase